MRQKLFAILLAMNLLLAPSLSFSQCVVPAQGAVVKTTSYTALANDTGKLIVMNCAGCTLTLPATPPSPVWAVWVSVGSSGSNVVISANGLTIDGAASILLRGGVGEGFYITTDNTNYFAASVTIGNYATAAGTANAQTVALNPAAAAYTAGLNFQFLPVANNTGSATVNVNSLGAVTIKKASAGALVNLAANDLSSTVLAWVVHDGTQFELLNPQTISGGGSSNGTVVYTSAQTASSSDNGKLVVMNCATACAYTLPNPQPSTTWAIQLQTIGTATATVALGASMTYNSGSVTPFIHSYQIIPINADSATATNYNGGTPVSAGNNVGITYQADRTSINASAVSTPTSIATRNTALSTQHFFTSTATNPVSMVLFSAYDSTVGVGCSGNTTVVWTLSWLDINGNTITKTVTETITGNGGTTASGDNSDNLFYGAVNINNATGVTVSNTYTAGTGCSTNPSYQAWLRLMS